MFRLKSQKAFGETEKDITASIRKYLNLVGIFHWKNWGGPMSTQGIPDILGCWKGRMIGIEVKTSKGRLNEKQKAFIERINEEGGLAFVAQSVDDVIKNLDGGKRDAL